MTTNKSKEQIERLLNGNSAYCKVVIELYICYANNLEWVADDTECLDGLTSDGLKVEIKSVKFRPQMGSYKEGTTLEQHLKKYCTADLFKIYHGTKGQLLNENLIETMDKEQFIKWATDRIYLDTTSSKKGSKVILRLSHNFRTQSMTSKMKQLGLI